MLRNEIVIVTGLPRSGTSMMMRMVSAAGIEALTDHVRAADADNPHGYFEFEGVKNTKADPSWLPGAVGKVVKMIHVLIPDLPRGFGYRIILMQRDMDEVVASQQTMLARTGRAGAANSAALKRVYAAQLESARRWMDSNPDCTRLEVEYASVIADPDGQAKRVAAFLGVAEAAGRMAAAVDPGLYRNRK
jgi:hypothetical protein